MAIFHCLGHVMQASKDESSHVIDTLLWSVSSQIKLLKFEHQHDKTQQYLSS